MDKLKQLIHLTQHETKLFQEFSDALESIKPMIEYRNWPDLDKSLKSIKDLGSRIEEQEGFRTDSFNEVKKELGVADKSILREILPLLNDDYQKELNDCSRELKQAIIKVKVVSQGMGYYLKNICSFIHDLLEELFPHRKGKIYSRMGQVNQVEGDSVMINHNL